MTSNDRTWNNSLSKSHEYQINKQRLTSMAEEFNKTFPSEEHCVEALFLEICPDRAIKCRVCNIKNFSKEFGARFITCCGKKTWFTAGTWFHRARKIRARFGTVWFLERGAVLNASILHDFLFVAHSSAWKMLLSLNALIEKLMQPLALQVHSSHFFSIVCKRSYQTPARAHPASEFDLTMGYKQEEAQALSPAAQAQSDNQPEERDRVGPDIIEGDKLESGSGSGSGSGSSNGNGNANSSSSEFDLPSLFLESSQSKSLEQAILQLLAEKPLNSDSILRRCGVSIPELSSALIDLELSGAIKRNVGDVYSLLPKKKRLGRNLDSAISGKVSAVLDFVRHYLHGVSFKYLQKYIALEWFCKDEGLVSRSLMRECLKSEPPSPAYLLHSASPEFVWIVA